MNPDSLRTRGVAYAVLFGPPRFISRSEASEIHDRLCDSLGWDDLSFQYRKTGDQAGDHGPSSGFEIECERREGRGRFLLRIGPPCPNFPIRMLMESSWPPSEEHFKQQFDMAHQAMFEQGARAWQRVHAEVRLRAQCANRQKRSIDFFLEKLLASQSEWFRSLGEGLSFASVRVDLRADDPGEDSLSNPKREIILEVLREDPSSTYVELLSQWPQLAVHEDVGQVVARGKLRAIDCRPSEYVENAFEFLRRHLRTLSRGN